VAKIICPWDLEGGRILGNFGAIFLPERGILNVLPKVVPFNP
jgi:hypothetical protein